MKIEKEDNVILQKIVERIIDASTDTLISLGLKYSAEEGWTFPSSMTKDNIKKAEDAISTNKIQYNLLNKLRANEVLSEEENHHLAAAVGTMITMCKIEISKQERAVEEFTKLLNRIQ